MNRLDALRELLARVIRALGTWNPAMWTGLASSLSIAGGSLDGIFGAVFILAACTLCVLSLLVTLSENPNV